MLWVRLPPELLAKQYVLAEQRSARLPVTQEIVGSNPIGDARQNGAVRKPVKRRSSNLRDRLWVRFPPVLLEEYTRDAQNVVPARACEFNSRLGYLNIAGATGVQLAFIRPVRSARYRDLQLDADGPVLIRAS
jgi:hypothetical protein